MEIVLKGLEDTEKFGYRLGSLLEGGDIVCLTGDLGAGKTTLTKSIAKGLDVKDYVTSPTFALINEYKGRVPVYHFDVYRLEGIEDVIDLGFEEYFYSKGVTIIEWGDKIEKFLPEDILTVEMNRGKTDNERIVSIFSNGKRSETIIEELKKN
ncbi:tRNA (adenosine(37)-N6)-threonylcarbamoyltransferase complex ATPase subunit type 1 TsaE [Anaerosalibacter bizertensis]|uniref:tRNA (Adenosine(37)-N6)-threonylcarbamoyltransferase complex ATPase subunit type 1 TsaE n=1 Tax=Anaerosalibacter bizertensis TaxID=932217 RepID=A0A9Q4FLB5_9FIRM|nr:tRNA (adenosine(37)-N6)-threonylcarbamoyltransferase complex ATPase subunit type 1 TsaE [Anaerosalibacter bizertensis]MBU5293003.1 tRNA (adenosine(37)-N6)-threonylcarbamoyltransferase complex ATPase subunit type 1 TsaE [Anaerosalibacter bizertensis]MCB5558381.1 tRNA (adenosine(37)-N6)-threonylcarbamoyltransferase complex ATPase subunit type 1 TsaE [Anaerosalibacter bizertensis]MCG4564668.1 tRNA (adenosine(37)-N6)-threonylcarbamoyltransferase complex ATPase subunit type 1 TsaE [Anaerosalibacte